MTEELIEQKAKEKSKQAFCVAHTHEDELIFRSGFIEGYHECQKEHVWHEIESKISPKREISKKYMPKSEEKVLLKYHFYDDNEVHISDGYYDAYDFQFHIANNPKHRIVCVIAWKELPKEIE